MILLYGLPPAAALDAPGAGLTRVATLEELTRRVTETPLGVNAVLLGPAAASPARAVQRVHAIDRDIAVLLVGEDAQRAPLLQALQFTPSIGPDIQWHATDAPEALALAAHAAAERTRRRRQHQLTVARASAGLDRPAAPVPERFLDHLLEQVPVGVCVVDEHGRLQNWNREAARVLGRSPAQLAGYPLPDAFPEQRRTLLELIGTAWQAEPAGAQLERHLGGGLSQTVRVKFARSASAEDPPGLLAVLEDVTEQTREAERQAALYAVTGELGLAGTPQEVVDVILRRAMPAVKADSGAVAVLSEGGSHLRLLGDRDLPERVRARLRELPLAADLPGAFAVRSGTPVFGTLDELEQRFGLVGALRPAAVAALAALPLFAHGQPFGFLTLLYEQPFKSFDEGELRFLAALADQCGQALDRARLAEAERRARERALLLAEASALLASSLDPRETLARLASLAARDFASWCAVHLMDDQGQLQAVVARRADSDSGQPTLEEWGAHPALPGNEEVLRSGRPRLVPAVTEEQPGAHRLRALGLHSLMMVPVTVRGAVAGVLSIGSGGAGREYGPADLQLAEELARRAANTLDNARLYQDATHSEQRLRTLIEATTQIVWTRTPEGEFVTEQPSWGAFTGQAAAELRGWGWLDAVHPEDRAGALKDWAGALASRSLYRTVHRLRRSDGEYRDVEVQAAPVLNTDGTVREWVGIDTDITERRRAEAMLRAQALILESIARGGSAPRVLADITRLAETLRPQLRASILLHDEHAGLLRYAAAPNLPAAFVTATDGIRPGPGAGACGSAAHSMQRVFMPDVQTDARFAPYRDIAARCGLRACWSTPILGDDGRLLGTFALYDSRPGLPSEGDESVIDMATHLAGIALESERKTRELRAGERRYRELLNNVPQIVWTVAADGRVEQVNERWREYTGVPLSPGGEEWRDVIHPEDRERVFKVRSARISQGEPYSYEARLRRFGGEYRWFLVQAQPVPSADGRTLRWVGGATDIHERRLAEQALHDSRNRLRFALEAAELGDWVLDLRDHSSWRSLRHDAIFGYPRGHASWTYETFLEHVLPEDRAEVDRKFRAAVQRGEAWDIECRVRRADGEERWIWTRARALPDQHGQERQMLGIVGDITELKRAEAEVRALNATLEQRVEQRARDLQTQTAALDAFVAYTEAVGTATETRSLARQALTVLQSRFSDASATYYEREGDLWKARVWTNDIPEETLATITAGLDADTPLIARTVRSRREEFVDAWDPQREAVENTSQFGSIGVYPLTVGGELVGLLAVGLKDTRRWTERDRTLVRAVGRSLNLALERAHQSVQLARQNVELEARTQALEGFASLTRDLTLRSNSLALVRRAQEVIMAMLPEGHAAYYQPEDDAWRLRSIVGEWGNPQLQAAVEAGLPYHTTRNFLLPWTTGQPYYQDVYDTSTDNLGQMAGHFAASAVLPVVVNGEPIGVLAVALFHARSWTATDKAVLESVVRSLGLALEGARSVAQLRQRTRELERSNRDLEQFAYVASHDLQEPLRTITSFTQLLAHRYEGQLDASADQYIRLTVEASQRMRQLVQDLLTYSRVRAENHELSTLNPAEVLTAVVGDLAGSIREAGAVITWDSLPCVQADPVQFRQLLQNLVGNAIKFRREGVTPSVHLSAQPEGKFVQFRVTDNGIGIERQYFERIFGVFQRLHGREQYAGTGVGLAICKRIVERHGGRLWVESRRGEGSTFHFTLPQQPAPPERTQRA